MIFVIASHVGFVNNKEAFGLSSHIIEYLKNKKKNYIYIKHCLSGITSSQIESTNLKTNLKVSRFHKANILLRSIEHVYINAKNISQNSNNKIVFIGIDPVNSISGAIMKLLKRIQKNIFICADFADKRYSNFLLNFIYHGIDKIALFFADEIWCVSTRILDKRLQQGVPKIKLRLLPNSPYFDLVPKRNYDGNMNLVVVTHFNKSFDLKNILYVLQELRNKNITVNLHIVGYGPEEERLKKMVKESGLSKNVKFLGQLEHLDVLNVISKSFLGFALYTSENPWNWYGDSMKAREYVAAGIPLIINTIPSTSDQVKKYNAGLVVEDQTEISKIVEFILLCIKNKKHYDNLRNNALKLGKDFDKKTILNNLFKNYI